MTIIPAQPSLILEGLHILVEDFVFQNAVDIGGRIFFSNGVIISFFFVRHRRVQKYSWTVFWWDVHAWVHAGVVLFNKSDGSFSEIYSPSSMNLWLEL